MPTAKKATAKKVTTKKEAISQEEIASPKQAKNRFLEALQKARKAMELRHSKSIKK